ncbi:MAG: carboxypeptidase regulatory-like domain-containing protein, partial [Planctomycetaceae bacterium]|nr:carboxypeptidase regulatory-like domain-containing protein [Planctomycetaceae bacterium]
MPKPHNALRSVAIFVALLLLVLIWFIAFDAPVESVAPDGALQDQPSSDAKNQEAGAPPAATTENPQSKRNANEEKPPQSGDEPSPIVNQADENGRTLTITGRVVGLDKNPIEGCTTVFFRKREAIPESLVQSGAPIGNDASCDARASTTEEGVFAFTFHLSGDDVRQLDDANWYDGDYYAFVYVWKEGYVTRESDCNADAVKNAVLAAEQAPVIRLQDIVLSRAGEIFGKVVEAGTGNPVAGVSVSLGGMTVIPESDAYGTYPWFSMSDREGTFRFTGLPTGFYMVQPPSGSTGYVKQEFRLDEGARFGPVTFQVECPNIVRFRLQTEQRMPITPPVEFVFLSETSRWLDAEPYKRPATLRNLRENTVSINGARYCGDLLFGNAPADSEGVYSASPRFAGMSMAIFAEGFLPIFVALRDEGIPVMDMGVFEVRKGRALSGTVTDTDGNPVAKAEVCTQAISVWTDAQGRFEFPDLAPGVFDLEAGLSGYEDFIQPVNVGDETELAIILQPAQSGTVVVTVCYDNQVPVEHEDIEIELDHVDSGMPSSPSDGGPGSMTFDELPPGNYLARVTRPFTGDVLEQAIDVAPGDVKRVAFLLPAGGRIFGEIADPSGAPLPGMAIRCYSSRNVACGASAGTSGAYEIRGLPPGTYYLLGECWAPHMTVNACFAHEFTLASPGSELRHDIDIAELPAIDFDLAIAGEHDAIRLAYLRSIAAESLARFPYVFEFCLEMAGSNGRATIYGLPAGAYAANFYGNARYPNATFEETITLPTGYRHFLIERNFVVGSLAGKVGLPPTLNSTDRSSWYVIATDVAAKFPEEHRCAINDDGTYRFDTLAAGTYGVQARIQDFVSREHVVNIGGATTLDLSVASGGYVALRFQLPEGVTLASNDDIASVLDSLSMASGSGLGHSLSFYDIQCRREGDRWIPLYPFAPGAYSFELDPDREYDTTSTSGSVEIVAGTVSTIDIAVTKARRLKLKWTSANPCGITNLDFLDAAGQDVQGAGQMTHWTDGTIESRVPDKAVVFQATFSNGKTVTMPLKFD